MLHRVVAVDQRGYGDSDKPSSISDYSLQALTNDLRQLVTALGIYKFHLLCLCPLLLDMYFNLHAVLGCLTSVLCSFLFFGEGC